MGPSCGWTSCLAQGPRVHQGRRVLMVPKVPQVPKVLQDPKVLQVLKGLKAMQSTLTTFIPNHRLTSNVPLLS